MYPSLQNKVRCKSASQTWSWLLIKSQQTCAVPPRVQTLGRPRLKGSGGGHLPLRVTRSKEGRKGSFTSPWLGNGSHAGMPLRYGAAPSSPPDHPPGCTCSSQASQKASRPTTLFIRVYALLPSRFQTLQSRA